MHHPVWAIIFLMVILKIPIVYLSGVVYYAVKAVPKPGEGAGVTARVGPDAGPEAGPGSRRRFRPQRFLPRPHGGPSRRYPRVPRTAVAQARARRR